MPLHGRASRCLAGMEDGSGKFTGSGWMPHSFGGRACGIRRGNGRRSCPLNARYAYVLAFLILSGVGSLPVVGSIQPAPPRAAVTV